MKYFLYWFSIKLSTKLINEILKFMSLIRFGYKSSYTGWNIKKGDLKLKNKLYFLSDLKSDRNSKTRKKEVFFDQKIY